VCSMAEDRDKDRFSLRIWISRWKLSIACFCLVVILLTVVHCRRQNSSPSIPQPPVPYEYNKFLAWFDRQDWDALGLKMKPSRTWFDAEMNVDKLHEWFDGEDLSLPLMASHLMNRYAFMENMMVTGDDSMQASLATHLLYLHLISPAFTQDGIIILDTGSGNGALLRLMALLGHLKGTDAKCIGFDNDDRNVQNARKLLLAEETRAEGPPAASVFKADIFQPYAVRRGLSEFGIKAMNSNGSGPIAHVIVVGAGIVTDGKPGQSRSSLALLAASSEPLRAFMDMLHPQGLLVAPICQNSPDQDGRCAANIMTFGKGVDGHIVVKRGGDSDKTFGPKKWFVLKK